MIKVAVIGNDQERLGAWSKLENAKVVAVLPSEGQEVSEAYVQKTIGNAADLNKMEVDVIDICVPVNEKAEVIQQIAKAGAHIISETPLAETVEEASVIVAQCEEKEMHLYAGNQRRFSPEYADARNQVNNGNIGKTGVTRLSSGAPHPGNGEDIFSGLGLAEFDWLLWTFGDVERVMAKHVKKERVNGSPVEYALTTLRFKDQSIAQVELSWAKSNTETSFEIAGDEGMLTHNSNESSPVSIQLSGSEEAYKFKEAILFKSALERQLEHVAALAEIENKPVKRADDALKPLQLAEAARKSAETGQPVQIEEVLS